MPLFNQIPPTIGFPTWSHYFTTLCCVNLIYTDWNYFSEPKLYPLNILTPEPFCHLAVKSLVMMAHVDKL